MPSILTLYGISNCDSVRKARHWLTQHNITYHFHDFRRDGLDAALLQTWAKHLGWQHLINKRGSTWRNLTLDDQQDLTESKAIALMLNHVALIKRPILHANTHYLLGFSEKEYENLLKSLE